MLCATPFLVLQEAVKTSLPPSSIVCYPVFVTLPSLHCPYFKVIGGLGYGWFLAIYPCLPRPSPVRPWKSDEGTTVA